MNTNIHTTEKVKANKKQLAIFVAIIAVLGVAYLLFTKAATPAVGFYFNPTTQTYNTGTQFSTQIMGSTTVPVQSMTVLVKYDPTVLRIDDTQATTGIDATWQTKAGCGNSDQVPIAPYGPTDLGPCRPAGEAYFVVANNLPSNLHVAGSALVVGNLKFTVLKYPTGGTTNLTIDTSLGNTKMTNSVTAGAQTTLDGRQTVDSTYTIRDAMPPPTAPQNLRTTTVGMSNVALAWNTTLDDAGGSGIVSYKVSRNGTPLAGVVTAPTTTFTDTGLVPSTAYTYTVIATDGGGNNSPPQSPVLSVTTAADTQAPTAPGVPTVGPGIADMSNIPLIWASSSDNVGVKNYIVKRGTTSANMVQIATPTTNTYNDTGLAPATTYIYTITAVDAAGNSSPPSQASLSTGGDTQAPTAPTNLSVSYPTSTSAKLSWGASTDNVGVVGYTVSKNGVVLTTGALVTSAIVNGATVHTFTDPTSLAPGNYTYTVVAKDAAGNPSPVSTVVAKINSPTDFNKDGNVGTVDLVILLSNMGKTGTGQVGDINGDGAVDTTDIVILLSKFGQVN